MDTNEVVKKFTNSLANFAGYSFATGYLESTLARIIDTYVKDEIELQKLQIQLLNTAIDYSQRDSDSKKELGHGY